MIPMGAANGGACWLEVSDDVEEYRFGDVRMGYVAKTGAYEWRPRIVVGDDAHDASPPLVSRRDARRMVEHELRRWGLAPAAA